MSQLWVPAYVAIGSNLDGPVSQVQSAMRQLASFNRSRLISQSRLYRSLPLGPQDQPEFVNAAVAMLTQLAPRELLNELKQLELSMGRAATTVRWGPRRIDLDLLVYGGLRIDEPDFTLPHPGVPDRNFVLYPLLDIAPTLTVPGHGSVAMLAARVGAAGLVPIT